MLISKTESYWSAIATLKASAIASAEWVMAFSTVTSIAGTPGGSAISETAQDYLALNYSVTVGPASANDDAAAEWTQPPAAANFSEGGGIA